MIELKHLTKTFEVSDRKIEALRDISLTIHDGDIYGIIGMSGAGKSTLVRCINMLERPTGGEVVIDGVDMCRLTPAELRKARREITMIFQGINLLMQRTCLRNICFPLELAGMPRKQAEERARELLELVGLPDKADTYPARLSGGQQQRIAIARALATQPKVLLCDEATSALDPNTTHAILSLIKDIRDKLGITVIVITHQMSVVEAICSRVAILDKGTVVEEGTVAEVFANPQTEAARRLVFPGNLAQAEDAGKGNRLQVTFCGMAATTTPLISRMAVEKGLMVNVIAASTREVSGKMYGSMLLEVPGGEKELDAVEAYFTACADILVGRV